MYNLDGAQQTEYPILLNIWESSVRATHHFLKEGDVDRLKKMIEDQDMFNMVQITTARNEANEILGFMGIADHNLEMLFVSAEGRGKGIGKLLIKHAIKNLAVTRVDVNEQNEQAVKFYKHFGFKTVNRSELDAHGNPYPLLHMALKV